MQGSTLTLSFLLALATSLCQVAFAIDDSATQLEVVGVECRDVTLPCVVSGPVSRDSRPRFSWTRRTAGGGSSGGPATLDCSMDGMGFIGGPPDLYRSEYTVNRLSCNLTIWSLRPSDAGCYQCDVWGPSGTFFSSVKLTVIEPVRSVSVRQLSQHIVQGVPAVFACSAGHWDAADLGNVRATWLLDGSAFLPESTTGAVTGAPPTASPDCLGRPESLFTLRRVLDRNHSGSVLECEVRTAEGLPPMRGSLRLPTVLVPPTRVEIVDRDSGQRYSRAGEEALVVGRENVTFDCLVQDTLPPASVSWFYRGQDAATGAGGRSSTETESGRAAGHGPGTVAVRGTLELPGLAWPDDGAELVCLATGAGNISVSLAIKILVDAPPQNVTLSSSGVVSESAINVFDCSAGQTRTASSIVWYLDDVEVTTAHNTSYSPERLQTSSTVSLQLGRQQSGARLRCDVHHRLLKRPISSEITLDVHFCTPPSLSCPPVVSTSETGTLTCATPGGRPPADLSLGFEDREAVWEPVSAGHQRLLHPPTAGQYGGVSTVLTANLTGQRDDHGRTVVCRRMPSTICPLEERDTCRLNVHFPPLEVQLSEGSDPDTDSLRGKLAVQVSAGREYRFTCGAIGSNPAADIRWLVAGARPPGTGADRTETIREETAGSWTARRGISLVAGRDVLHGQNLTCEVLYPPGVVYRERNLEFNVIAVAPLADAPAWTVVTIACSVAVVSVAVLCMVVTLCKRKSVRGGRYSPSHECTGPHLQLNDRHGHEAGECTGSLLWSGAEATLPAGCEAYEFPREKLVLCGVIGSGSFGQVYKATAEDIYEKGVCSTVAVKTPNPCGSPTERDEFLKELEMFTVLVPHPNVVSMLGYCRKTDPVYLIMEYVPNGNLENYLRREKQYLDQCYTNLTSGSIDAIGPVQILSFALQIARGMRYLASVQCIHRDLATRNILLDEHFVCKVSDFGLARHVPVQKQYEMKSEGRVPFRWMAPESILSNVYTTKSDVWSFGVLLWELITLGSHPYPGQSCPEILEDLKKGIRLKKPAHCSDEVYQLMTDCWEGKPEARPDFDRLHTMIGGMLSNASGYLTMSNFKTDQYVYMAPGANSN